MHSQPDADRADAAAARAAIAATNARHAQAFNQGDVAGFARVYTEDARILPPDMEPVHGRAAIAEFWAGAAEQLKIRELRLVTDELEVVGARAVEEGRVELQTGQGLVRGKYIVVWRREPDGGWRWHRDIWNFSPGA